LGWLLREGATHCIVIGQEKIDAPTLQQFDQLLQARYLLRYGDAASLQPGHAVASQHAADAQLAVPNRLVEDQRILGIPVPFLHQKRGGQLRVAIDLAVWGGAEETIGDMSADILPRSAH